MSVPGVSPRLVARLLVAAWIGVGIASQAQAKEKEAGASQSRPGVVTEEPQEGRFVKIDGGFMVPYTETIPGTEVTFEMVPVPGGEFLMGSPAAEAGRNDDEGPPVQVRVAPFWIGKHEVTWAEYKAYMSMYDAFKKFQRLAANRAAATGQPSDEQQAWQLVEEHAWRGDIEATDIDGVTAATPLYDPSYTYGAGEEPNQPAVTMTQFAARQFTKWLSGITGEDYRLPSEAEWEYAARAGTKTAYSFGEGIPDLDKYAWHDGNADYETHPVGEKAPNPWELHDMHGNAAEWTLDEYQENTYQKLGAGPVAAKEAVRWPTKVFPHVIRGGSWLDATEMLRSAARHKSEEDEWKLSDPSIPLSPWWYTEEAAMGVGMRIVRPLEPLSAAEKEHVWEADVESLREDVKGRLAEGRGAQGVADESLPAAIEAASKLDTGE